MRVCRTLSCNFHSCRHSSVLPYSHPMLQACTLCLKKGIVRVACTVSVPDAGTLNPSDSLLRHRVQYVCFQEEIPFLIQFPPPPSGCLSLSRFGHLASSDPRHRPICMRTSSALANSVLLEFFSSLHSYSVGGQTRRTWGSDVGIPFKRELDSNSA